MREGVTLLPKHKIRHISPNVSQLIKHTAENTRTVVVRPEALIGGRIGVVIDHASIIDDAGASGHVDFAQSIPAGSVILAVKFDYTEAFNSDNTTTLKIQVGPTGDLDAFNKTASGENGFNTTTDTYWGGSSCQDAVVTATAAPRVTFTEDSDITQLISGAGAQGAIAITITYMRA